MRHAAAAMLWMHKTDGAASLSLVEQAIKKRNEREKQNGKRTKH